MRSASSLAERIVVAVALVAAAGCHGKTEVPAPGAALLRVIPSAPARPTPADDPLRAVRLRRLRRALERPAGPLPGRALVPESASLLGTILIQPGTTAGDLRIDLRGLLAGALVDEGTVKIPAAELSGGTFALTLEAALPVDSDGDGVPDPVDDCPLVPDPSQGRVRGRWRRHDRRRGRSRRRGRRSPRRRQRRPAGRGRRRARRRAGRPNGRRPRRAPGEQSAARARGAAPPPSASSGFCTDGVCCKTACTDPCNSCVTRAPAKRGQERRGRSRSASPR